MKTISQAALCALLAVCGLASMASASALAATPQLVNSSDAKLAKNKFTLSQAEPTYEWRNGTLRCNSLSATGEVTGTRTVGNVTVLLKGCAGSEYSCKNESAGEKKEPVIKSLTLQGNIGWINEKEKLIGLTLESAPRKYTEVEGRRVYGKPVLWAEFGCGIVNRKLLGQYLGEFEIGTEQLTHTMPIAYTKSVPTTFEAETKVELVQSIAGGTEESAWILAPEAKMQLEEAAQLLP